MCVKHKTIVLIQEIARNKVWWTYCLMLYYSVFLVILGQVKAKRSELSESRARSARSSFQTARNEP